VWERKRRLGLQHELQEGANGSGIPSAWASGTRRRCGNRRRRRTTTTTTVCATAPVCET